MRYYVELCGSRGTNGGEFRFTYNGKRGVAIREIAGAILMDAPIDATQAEIHIRDHTSRDGYRIGPNGIQFKFRSNGPSSVSLPFELDEDRDVKVVVTLGGQTKAWLITKSGLVDSTPSRGKAPKKKKHA